MCAPTGATTTPAPVSAGHPPGGVCVVRGGYWEPRHGRREREERHGHSDKVGTGRPAGLAREGGGRDSGAGGTARTAGLGAGACSARGDVLCALGAIRRN